ncbi:hypothetical protein DFH06DRAFT_537066 [Mycena polygramma]|nr:hypothetical protein DFH06DRAFT_537066 [Mycena polygramma]
MSPSRIFVHCLPSHGRVSASPSRAPLLLAQICRHWREVAIATCGLWRSLYFDPGIDFDTVLQKPALPDEAFQNLLRCWFFSCQRHSTGFRSQFPVPESLTGLPGAGPVVCPPDRTVGSASLAGPVRAAPPASHTFPNPSAFRHCPFLRHRCAQPDTNFTFNPRASSAQRHGTRFSPLTSPSPS